MQEDQMAQDKIDGRVIAMLATDGFEQAELSDTRANLERAGAKVEVIAPAKTLKAGEIKGWKVKDWGDTVKVDRSLDNADPGDYDALVLPGGVINPDKLRLEDKAIRFVRDFAATGKPVAAICHGPWLLINAGLARDKKVTSWPSVKTDLQNAGGRWQDAEVVIDGQLITSRKPDDIPAFSRAIVDAVAHR
jgi:deglycase